MKKQNVKVKDAKPKKLYCAWTEGDVAMDEEGYFNTYTDLESAIDSHPGAEMFEATVKPIGKYKKVTSLVKIEEKRKAGRPKKV